MTSRCDDDLRKALLVSAFVSMLMLGSGAALALSPAPSSNDSIKKGDDFLTDDKLAEAAQSYETAIHDQPKNSVPHQRLGRVYALEQKLKPAAQELSKAISLDSNNALAHLDMGWVFGMQGAYQSSISEERIAVGLDPANVSAFLNLGVALVHENEADSAMRAFQSAIALDPNNVEAMTNLASLVARQGQYSQAMALYRRAIALDNANAAAHLGLGSALGRLGDKEHELEEFKQAASLAPRNPSAHGKLGWALYSTGDLKGALSEGIVANGLRIKRTTSEFIGTLAAVIAGLVVLAGIIFVAIVFGSRFNPRADEKIIRSFFLVFYKDKAGRFVITNHRLVFSPEALSQWLGATRLSFEYVDIETFKGSTALRGGSLSLLCANGNVYHFAMPVVVLEPLLDELKKIRFGAEEEMDELEEPIEIVDSSASQMRLMKIKRVSESLIEVAAKKEEEKPKPSEEGLIVTVVDLPDQFKKTNGTT